MRRIVAATVVAVGLAAAPAAAQLQAYCTVTKVTTEALSNATRITISADGILDFDADGDDFWVREGSNWYPRRSRTIVFRLPNARAALGSFVDVGVYPASHVQFAIPRESRDGTGLNVTVWLYRAAIFTRLQTRSWHMGSRRSTAPFPQYAIEQSEDGRRLMVIVRSDRYREPGPPREESLPTRTALSVTSDGDGLISVHALNARLGEVLRAVSETDGLEIVVRGGAGYRASMTIERVLPATIMRAIAQGYGLSVRKAEGAYYVTEGLPNEVDSYWASPTATFPVRHLAPDVALDLLPDFLLRYVHVNAGRNALVASGPPSLLEKLESDLRVIDQPQPQIELSALLVEEQATRGLDLAAEALFTSGVYGLSASAETGRIGYTIVPEPLHDLQVRLRALEEVGRIRTRVCPSVTVASGSKADLFLGSRQYFLFLTSPRYAAQEVILTSADVGSRISAQPWTGDAQTIVVPLQVQANTVASVDDQGLPLVSTRRAKGTVRLQSGDTILFSGLAMELTERGRRRLAPPSSLLAGELLPSHRRRREATEVLVLVSARGRYEAREAAPQTKSM